MVSCCIGIRATHVIQNHTDASHLSHFAYLSWEMPPSLRSAFYIASSVMCRYLFTPTFTPQTTWEGREKTRAKKALTVRKFVFLFPTSERIQTEETPWASPPGGLDRLSSALCSVLHGFQRFLMLLWLTSDAVFRGSSHFGRSSKELLPDVSMRTTTMDSIYIAYVVES